MLNKKGRLSAAFLIHGIDEAAVLVTPGLLGYGSISLNADGMPGQAAYFHFLHTPIGISPFNYLKRMSSGLTMQEIRWKFPPIRPARRMEKEIPTSGRPVHIESNGFTVRSMRSGDDLEHLIALLNDPEVLQGLNIPSQGFNDVSIRHFIRRFDGVKNYFMGVFEGNELIGFITIDVNLAHKIGVITSSIDKKRKDKKRVYWATADAVLDYFFDQRDIEKMVARVLEVNKSMLFNFVDNTRYFYEARLQKECLGLDGNRYDLLQFAAFKNGKRPDGLPYIP